MKNYLFRTSQILPIIAFSIYNAPSEEEGRQALDDVKETWDERYPRAMTRWYDNWDGQ
jgi:transposase-like protein